MMNGQELDLFLPYPDTTSAFPVNFGANVVMEGDIAVVGSFGAIAVDETKPVVCFYRKNNLGDWTFQLALDGYDFSDTHNFNSRLAIDSQTVVIGNPFFKQEEEQTGIVYIYSTEGDNWNLEKTLIPSIDSGEVRFGASVAIDDNWLAVGDPAYIDSVTSDTTGAVFFYQFVGESWEYRQRIQASSPENNMGFGQSIDMSHGDLIVGSLPLNPDMDSSKGAYFFKRSGTEWTEQFSFTPESEDLGSYFGFSVAIDDSTAIIGSPGQINEYDARGFLYIFNKGDGWTFKEKFTSPNLFNDSYGWDVSIKNNKILVGAPFLSYLPEVDGYSSAFLYLFRNDEWVFEKEISSYEVQELNSFGRSVALSDDDCIIGDPLYAVEIQTDIPEWVNFGAAYIYDLSEYNVSINEVHSSVSNLRLSPNPTAGNFRISFKSEEKNIRKVQVFDLLGREVFVRDYAGYSSIELETSSWPTGLYIVVVNGVWVEKLVKN